MMRDNLIGAIGTLASFTLDSVHLIAASLAGLFTAVHMGICIRDRLVARKKDDDK